MIQQSHLNRCFFNFAFPLEKIVQEKFHQPLVYLENNMDAGRLDVGVDHCHTLVLPHQCVGKVGGDV